jgi:Predicted membrane protein
VANDIGRLILRLVLGVCVLLHGIAKLLHGVSGISGMLAGAGLPGFLAYGVYVGEVIGPILVILGFYSRIGAWVIVINMLFALGLVHMGEVLSLGRSGGWAIELQAMFLFTAVALALLGPGRYAINSR